MFSDKDTKCGNAKEGRGSKVNFVRWVFYVETGQARVGGDADENLNLPCPRVEIGSQVEFAYVPCSPSLAQCGHGE